MSDALKDIQESLIEYFIDTDDITFVDFVDSFVYHVPTDDEKISKLIESFLEDNGLVVAYTNYVLELKKRPLFIHSPSETDMIEKIKSSFLSLSYNRFRRALDKPKAKSSPLVKLSRGEKDDLKLVIDACERDNDNLVADEETTREMFDEDEANELIDERKRLSKLFPKVLKILK